MMHLSIDRFFRILKDGDWHNVGELSDQLSVRMSRLTEFCTFLSERGLVKYDDTNSRIKIEPIWKLLLPEIGQPTEPRTAVATFIIPPETSIDVQSTRISNIGNVELEIGLQINSRIKEVAVKT